MVLPVMGEVSWCCQLWEKYHGVPSERRSIMVLLVIGEVLVFIETATSATSVCFVKLSTIFKVMTIFFL